MAFHLANAGAYRQIAGLKVAEIPAAYNPVAHYACAVITPEAQRLAEFLGSEPAKAVLRKAGFGCHEKE